MSQFISEFLIQSIETLEHIASKVKPKHSLQRISEARQKFKKEYARYEVDPGLLKQDFGRFDEEYRAGRGNLGDWTPALLDDIDDCFVNNYTDMGGAFPVESLFFPKAGDNLDRYDKYCNEVDNILRKPENKAPPFARYYFAVSTIWAMRGYSFPVPLGTRSVVECLHKMTLNVRRGFEEVRPSLALLALLGRECLSLVSRLLTDTAGHLLAGDVPHLGVLPGFQGVHNEGPVQRHVGDRLQGQAHKHQHAWHRQEGERGQNPRIRRPLRPPRPPRSLTVGTPPTSDGRCSTSSSHISRRA